MCSLLNLTADDRRLILAKNYNFGVKNYCSAHKFTYNIIVYITDEYKIFRCDDDCGDI